MKRLHQELDTARAAAAEAAQRASAEAATVPQLEEELAAARVARVGLEADGERLRTEAAAATAAGADDVAALRLEMDRLKERHEQMERVRQRTRAWCLLLPILFFPIPPRPVLLPDAAYRSPRPSQAVIEALQKLVAADADRASMTEQLASAGEELEAARAAAAAEAATLRAQLASNEAAATADAVEAAAATAAASREMEQMKEELAARAAMGAQLTAQLRALVEEYAAFKAQALAATGSSTSGGDADMDRLREQLAAARAELAATIDTAQTQVSALQHERDQLAMKLSNDDAHQKLMLLAAEFYEYRLKTEAMVAELQAGGAKGPSGQAVDDDNDAVALSSAFFSAANVLGLGSPSKKQG
jgi:hypothetical protein